MPSRVIGPAAMLFSTVLLSACGGPSVAPRSPGNLPSTAIVDPAALYCTGMGGTVTRATSGGRRADLCRLPDGRSVTTASLINSHNDL